MSTLDLSAESKRRPAEVVSDVALSDEAVGLMEASRNTLQYLQSLCGQGLYADAFLTLARALPRQFAVMWAARCMEELAGKPPTEDEARCLALVKQWLGSPDEQLRRECMAAAEQCDFDGAWAWLAAAVAFSGGSLVPDNLDAVPPAAHLTAVAVSACLHTLTVENQEARPEMGQQMIDSGLQMVAIPGGAGAG